MSILCGTDFSAETRDVIRVAALFARRKNEPLQLVHAIDAPVLAAGDADLKARLREEADRHMHHDVRLDEPEVVPALRRVLVATDFSAIGNQAVAHAHAIVAHGGTVHMLHVAASDQASESHRRASIEKLRKLIPESAKRVETRLDVDAGLLGALLGSVAREVSERCRRQVFFVPPSHAES